MREFVSMSFGVLVFRSRCFMLYSLSIHRLEELQLELCLEITLVNRIGKGRPGVMTD